MPAIIDKILLVSKSLELVFLVFAGPERLEISKKFDRSLISFCQMEQKEAV
ncbi:hypothetical protein HMPREF1557_01536 [Streptococcus sobrinus W1703]|uniref:Uncharacterized protein n=1 Tax=Streptococcus sobrinus W1703 TaxID=1227275 RepID=U2IL26_9STRE|nr:hypothetical protein HMPREF1557_01536 [Streptococcus sobrinus W1703]